MKRFLTAVFLVTGSLQAQSMQAALMEVLQSNPVVIEKLQNFKAISTDVAAAESGYYPSVDLSLTTGREETDRTPTGGATTTTDFDATRTSVTYSQNLFKGFETLYRVDEQNERAKAAAYSYIQTVNDTALELINAYTEVMRQKELLAIARQNVEINEEIFNKVSKLYESGLTTLSEVNKIESSLALARSNAVVNENNLASTTFALERLLGHASDLGSMSKPTFHGTLPANEPDALEFAFEHNPALRVGDYNIRQALAAKKTKEAAYYPEVDLEISQSYSDSYNAYDGEEDRFAAMATVSFNVFNGFADKAAVEKAAIETRQERSRYETLRRQVREGLHLAWSSYVKLTEQLKHLSDYKEFSLKTLTLYSKEYDLGRRSLLDLLAAQSDYIGAKSQTINTEYDILLSQYRILDVMGITVESLLGDHSDHYVHVGLKAPVQP